MSPPQSPPARFLGLPRELRQQILAETYKDLHNHPHRRKSPQETLNWARNKLHNPYARGLVSDLLNVADQWTGVLKQVHADIEDDVDYVVDTMECIKETREILRGLDTISSRRRVYSGMGVRRQHHKF